MKPSSQFNLRYFKVYLGLLFSLLFFQAIANGDDKDKKPGNAAENTSDLLKKRLIHQRLVSSGDPVFFVLRSNKQRAKQGEEVELTVSAHFLEEAHRTFVVYKELYGYTLRLITPDGFVVTGGSFHDLLQGKVSRQNPTQHYTIKGYFENDCSNCEFKLLRGTYDRMPSEEWIYKQSLILNVPEDELIIENKEFQDSTSINTKGAKIKSTNASHNFECKDKGLTVTFPSNYGSVPAMFDVIDFGFVDCENRYDAAGNAEMFIKIQNKTNLELTAYHYLCYGNSAEEPTQFTLNPSTTESFTFSTKVRLSSSLVHPHVWPCIVSDLPTNFNGQNSLVTATIPISPRTIALSLNQASQTVPAGTTLSLIMSGCPSDYNKRWFINGTQLANSNSNQITRGFYEASSSTTIKAECFNGPTNCLVPTNTITISVPSGCTTPIVSATGANTVIRGNNVALSVSGCTSATQWKKNGIDIANGTAYNLTAYEAGSYQVSCTAGSCTQRVSNTITVTHSGTPGLTHDQRSLSVSPDQRIELTAFGCNAVYTWSNGVSGASNVTYVTGPGTYKVKCVNNVDPNIYSGETSVTFTHKAGNSPNITTDGTHCLRPGETKNITATCITGYNVYWGETNTLKNSDTRSVGAGSYTAKCCAGSTCSPETTVEICSGTTPTECNNLSTPVASLNPATIRLGQYFDVSATGCNGEISWYKDNVLYKTGVSSFTTNELGSYHASCAYPACDVVLNSNSLYPMYAALTIQHDVPNNEIVQGVPFQLTAVGCADGWVQWSTAGGGTRTDNPIWESAPGLYKARCIKEDKAFSDWVSVFFRLRTATTPQISKPEQCFYANEKVFISGTCPTGMTLNWLDGTWSSSFPAYKEVTPGVTYRAQCCNGGENPNNCGSVVDITVCTISPKIQQIIADKEDPITRKAFAAPNEPVLLTATGCSNGTVHWMYNGQNQYGNPITVYGPGIYYARCTVSDQSYSNTISREVFAKPPGEVSIISSQSTAFPGQLLTLTATGCNGGQVHWRYTVSSQTITMTARTIDVTGPNTYYAKCIVNATTGPEANINIPQASGLPKITVNKSRVRPNETFTFQVDFSACPNYGWPGGGTKVTQNGVTTNMWGWDPVTITGPAILEADCANASWQKQTKEIFLAPGDNIRLVANKSKTKITETVLLTTYGCDYGYIEWKIGDNTIMGSMADPKREITQTGPGLYKARCKEDFNVNSDWVSAYVDIDGTIVPVINGPNSLCPNTEATLTTTGCPDGYYNAWSTLEQGGFTYGGNSVTVYLPQTVKLRCHKNDNSWTSDEKPFTIQSAIPDDIKATSNSPVVTAGTVQLAGTAITGATYLWTPPAGVTLSTPLNTRTLQITGVTAAQSGEYKLQVTSGGCVVQVSTRVDVNLCDNLYIKAFDPIDGEEKTNLVRKPGQVNLYDDLVLQVETFDGDILKGVNYTWTFPQGITGTVDPNAQHKTTVNKVGNYKMNVTSAGGVSCPLEIDVSALACATPADFTACGATGTVASTGTEKLKNLAVGDEFSTYDYIVRVTEVSGNETTGWTGKGELVMNFLKIGSSPVVEIPLAVEFEGINLNQCYQLLAGPKVKTTFDPNWSNVVSVDEVLNIANDVNDKVKEVKNVIEVFNCLSDQKTSIDKLVQELNTSKTKLLEFQDITSAERTTLTTNLQSLIDNIACIKNQCTNANSRVDLTDNSCNVSDLQVLQSANIFLASSNTIIPIPDASRPETTEESQIRSKKYSRIKLKIRTYLPFNYVIEPPVNFKWNSGENYTSFPFNSKMINLANIRNYAQYKDAYLHGGYKTSQEIVLDFTNGKVENGRFHVPPSHTLNTETNKVNELENTISTNYSNFDGVVNYDVLKILKYTAKITSGNPAVVPAPTIDYKLVFSVREDGYYTIDILWDGFPAIEVFMEDLDTGAIDLVYESKPAYTRGEPGTEYKSGQILKLIDGFGDIKYKTNNYLGYKKHTDLSSPKFANDVQTMVKRFNVKNIEDLGKY